jgi:Endoplasmic Reticulum-Golgi Intermediate Compartment (ERGIC)
MIGICNSMTALREAPGLNCALSLHIILHCNPSLLQIASEVRSYVVSLSGQKEHLRVDTTLGKKLDVNLNMTFHAINCLDLHVDAMDVAGDNQIDVEHHMLKQRLTKDGAPLADAISEVN